MTPLFDGHYKIESTFGTFISGKENLNADFPMIKANQFTMANTEVLIISVLTALSEISVNASWN